MGGSLRRRRPQRVRLQPHQLADHLFPGSSPAGSALKLYDFPAAANCQRVTLYLAEKGLQIPRVHVDIQSLQQRTPEFLRKNPAGKIPVLETDDGTFIAESAAIVEYLEELFPQPAMIGNTAL